MINLIPNEEKHKKVKDFYFRLSVVFLATLGFSVLIVAIAILPSYFLSLEKKNLINAMLETQRNEPVPLFDQKNLSAVNDLKGKLNLAEQNQKKNYSVTQNIINEILLKKMPDIKITEISYDNSFGKGKTVLISGLAVSRERLLLFRQALEEDPTFKKVDLPISNFIKGSNIDFSLNLIPS